MTSQEHLMYQIIGDYNLLKQRKMSLNNIKKTMRSMQDDALANGTANMDMDEIDKIIAEVRQENRR